MVEAGEGAHAVLRLAKGLGRSPELVEANELEEGWPGVNPRVAVAAATAAEGGESGMAMVGAGAGAVAVAAEGGWHEEGGVAMELGRSR